MRLKNTADNFSASFHITPPYQMVVIHSSKLIYLVSCTSGASSASALS